MIQDIGENVIAIIQAREQSARFPSKILKKINNLTLLEILLKRLSKSKKVDNIVVACTSKIDDRNIINICRKENIDYYIGSKSNVLKRYYDCSKKFKYKYIVRITSDCPLVDPYLVDRFINIIKEKKFDYISNTLNPTYPDGFDIEVFKSSILKKAYLNAKSDYDKEHVTTYIKSNIKVNKYSFENKKDLSNLRLTIDEPIDFLMLKKTLKKLRFNLNFNYKDIEKIFSKNPKFFDMNKRIKRNSGSFMSKGEKIWKRANQIIPDGNMLLSKRPNIFTNNKWPTYFSKTKEYFIWDLDGKKYKDFSYMGVGTNLLGYSNNLIDKKIKNVIDKGNISTLNCVEEVFLTEKLLNIHKWAGMAKYAKTGGEAATIALRIARSFNNKEKIIVCGYHGWHDWYLSAQLSKKGSLKNHLFENIKIKGVPDFFKNTTFAFNFNNINELKEIIKKNKNKISALIMEVQRNIEPKINFFKSVEKICKKNRIILILDECTSGFRENIGGLHIKYKIKPDIVLYGKSMSNGYPITAILGKKNIMEAAKSTFISSTYWTDRIGFVAAIETIKQMEKIKPWKSIQQRGKFIKKEWDKIFKTFNFDVKIYGLNSMPSFIFKKNHNSIRQFITDEMLKKGYLATNSVYVSISHTKSAIENYLKTFKLVIKKLHKSKIYEKESSNRKKTFNRLN